MLQNIPNQNMQIFFQQGMLFNILKFNYYWFLKHRADGDLLLITEPALLTRCA